MSRTLGRLLSVGAGLAAFAILASPTVGLASVASIQVVSGQLIAKGAEVDVTVSFSCPAGDIVPTDQQWTQGGLTASVQEAVSKTQQASGFGSAGGQACTGSPQTAVIQVLAAASGPPFKVGPAVVSASIFECDPSFSQCSSATSGLTTVRLSK